MGLAPYGKSRTHMVSIDKDARLKFQDQWIAEQRHRPMPTPAEFRDRFDEYADLAAATQDAAENAVLALDWARRASGEDYLAYWAGWH